MTDQPLVHVLTEDCPCRPTLIPVERPDGSVGYVHAHHNPEDDDPEFGAERVAAIARGMEIVRAQGQGGER